MKDNLIFGVHACKRFLEQSSSLVKEIYVQEGKAGERLIQELNLEKGFVFLEKSQLEHLTQGGRHQGIVLRVAEKPLQTEKQLSGFLKLTMEEQKAPLFLVLDNITDPHNLGACLRSAAAAGVSAVILPKDKSASINATVRKVAVGAVDILDIFVVSNLARAIDKMKDAGVWLIGTALDDSASSIYESDLAGPLAIVMGSEGQGLRRLTQEKCDFLCFLPMPGNMQSLNVSVATGIFLFEALRQRGQTG